MVPPIETRHASWEDDWEMDERRNEVERRFRHVRGERGIFSRVEKLAVIVLGFSVFALIMDALRECEHDLTGMWFRLWAPCQSLLLWGRVSTPAMPPDLLTP